MDVDSDLHTSHKESWNTQQSIPTTSRIQDDEDESSLIATFSVCFLFVFRFRGICSLRVSAKAAAASINLSKLGRVEGSGWNGVDGE